MKNIITITAMILLTSCGAIQDECGRDIKMACNTFLGEKNTDSSTEIDVLKNENNDIRTQIENNLNETNGSILDLGESIELSGQDIQIVNPCEEGVNDEVLILLDNKVLALYYGSKNRIHLTELANGRYVTTDNEKCRFTVIDGEILD